MFRAIFLPAVVHLTEAVHKIVGKLELCPRLCVFNDIFHHPTQRATTDISTARMDLPIASDGTA